MNEVKRYMTAIERGLRMDWPTRMRIMNDLTGDFQSRREAGQSDAEIMAELGTPAQVAAEFNAAFPEQVESRRPSRWRWPFLVLAMLTLLATALAALPGLFFNSSVGVIGGADGPTAIFVTAAVDGQLTQLAGGLFAAAMFAAFLLLGWCQAGRRRLWLPIALCVLPLALTVRRLLQHPLQEWAGLLTPGLVGALLAALLVLLWVLRRYRKK